MNKIVLTGLWNAEARRLDDNGFIKPSDKLEIRLPGSLVDALQDNNMIKNPHDGLNRLKYNWIDTSEWAIKRSFTLEGKKNVLYFGPDAMINGEKVSNEALITEYVKEENEIEIITSATLPECVMVIETDDAALIDAKASTKRKKDDIWTLYVAIKAYSDKERDIAIGTELHGRKDEINLTLKEGIGTYSFELEVEKPELWQPVGYGYPHLYPFSLIFLDTRYDTFIAFKRDKRIFQKGVFWTPLPPSATNFDYERLVKGVAESGMNTIFLASDEKQNLYDAADRYGVYVKKTPLDLNIKEVDLEPSLPSINTVKSFAHSTVDFSLSSPVMEAHESEKGLGKIVEKNIAETFGLPSSFEKCVYLSQLESSLDAENKAARIRVGKETDGIAIKSLNDTWPSIRRTALEYNGRWKTTMYAIRMMMASVCPIMIIDNDILSIFIANDTDETLKAELSVKFRHYSGQKKDSREYPVTLEAGSISKIDSYPLSWINKEDVFCYAKLSSKNIHRERSLILCRMQDAHLENPNIKLECKKSGNRTICIRINAEKPAFYVTLNSGSIRGIFSDNMISVRPSAEKNIIFRADEDISVEAFEKELTVFDLFNAIS